MLRHKNIDRVCCVIVALTLLVTTLFVGAAATGAITGNSTIGYESRLFDTSRVHTIDIVMDDWDAFLDTCTSEEYAVCQLVIDGEHISNAAIRGKGNTSLSSVAAYGNDRYSFKVEFDHYQAGSTYHGLDKLSLNNLIQDNTYMKDYFAYTLMNRMGVAAPLCSFVKISVNGEYWGLYLAVEGVEDSFLRRNYGKNYGELYKPDSMSFGGGRGNGRDFDMGDMSEKFGFSFGREEGEDTAFPMTEMPAGGMPFDPSEMMGGFGGFFGDAATSPTMTVENADSEATTAAPAEDSMPGGFDPSQMPADMGSFPGMPAGGEMPDMGSMPGGFDPSQMPGGMGAFPGMPAAAEEPQPTQTGAPAEAPAEQRGKERPFGSGGFDPSQFMNGDFEMPGRDFGGFGGFGSSSDVKLQYIDEDPASYANIFNNAKTDITKADQARLITSLKALNEGDTSVVDVEAVIRYMAVHNFLCNDDSYTGMMVHNYYLYEEDGVLSMIPWDYNLAYGGFTASSNGTSAVNTSISRLVSMGSDSDRPMAGWITASEEYTAQYLATYQELMDTVFASGWFEQEIDRVIAMIDPYVQSDPTAFCSYEEFQTGSTTLKAFCLKRAESVTNQLNGNNTRVDASDVNLSVMGSMSGMGGFGGPGGGFGGRSKDDSETAERPSTGGMPAFDMPFDRGGIPQQNAAQNWTLLAVCAIVLLAGLFFVKLIRIER